MKVKEQGEGRRAEAGGDPQLPLQPTLGHGRGCQAIAQEHEQVFAA